MRNFSPFIDPHCDIYCIVSHPFHGQCQIIILRMLWHHHHHILRIIFTLSLLTQTCMDSAVDSGQVVYFALSAALCRNRHQSLAVTVTERSASRLHCPTGISWLTDTALSPGQCPSSTRPCPRSPSTRPLIGQQATSRPLIGNTRGLSQDTSTQARHNQVLSPPVTKDTLAQNFPQKVPKRKVTGTDKHGWSIDTESSSHSH